ncbi:MAG: hypothetical protein ACI8RA_001919 [Chlamydiales bacterium]|jgi:hypothetical protein
MFHWINEFKDSSRETKFFAITAFFLGFIVLGASLFAFLRLDYVRSYETGPKTELTHED